MFLLGESGFLQLSEAPRLNAVPPSSSALWQCGVLKPFCVGSIISGGYSWTLGAKGS